MKNIAIIIPDLADGGAERVASNLSLYLSEKYQRYIIVYTAENIVYPYNGNLINLNIKTAVTPFGKMINFLKKIVKIRRIKTRYHIQATISFMEGPNIVNIFTRVEDKVILSIRTFISKRLTSFYGKIYKILIKAFYPKADAIVVVSKAIGNDLTTNFGIELEKIKVIYNPCDIERISQLAEKEIAKEYLDIYNYPVIINVGRLTEVKGQMQLICVFKKVKEELGNVKLVILGQGKLEVDLRKLIKRLGLDKDVFLLGFQKNPFKFISKSTIYVSTSFYEGFPNALLESMICGLPIISTDCKSGPREILAPNTDIEQETKTVEYSQYGILVPVLDEAYHSTGNFLRTAEETLAKSIIDLLQSEETMEHYRQASRTRVTSFSMMKFIEEYESIIE